MKFGPSVSAEFPVCRGCKPRVVAQAIGRVVRNFLVIGGAIFIAGYFIGDEGAWYWALIGIGVLTIIPLVVWDAIFPAYERARKPNGDAIAELSKRNFVEMSDLSGDPMFQLRKAIEAKFSQRHPDLWTPLYSLVTFSPEVPYAEALRLGDEQKEVMDKIMQIPDIEDCWDEARVMDELHRLATERFGG